MLLNLKPAIDVDLTALAMLFKKVGCWKQIDYAHFEYKDRIWPTVTFFHDILYYEENNQDMAVPWVVIRISFKAPFKDVKNIPDKLIEQNTNIVLKTLEKVKLKPFSDEDAYRRHFTHPVLDDDVVSLKCFVNPNYRKGYWQNHAIPYK